MGINQSGKHCDIPKVEQMFEGGLIRRLNRFDPVIDDSNDLIFKHVACLYIENSRGTQVLDGVSRERAHHEDNQTTEKEELSEAAALGIHHNWLRMG